MDKMNGIYTSALYMTLVLKEQSVFQLTGGLGVKNDVI